MDNDKGLPFVSRKMLSFENGVQFKLRLSVEAVDLTANELEIRGMTKEGMFIHRYITNNTGILSSGDFAIPDVPIFVSVIDRNGAFQQGQCTVTLQLMANGIPFYELCSGQVYRQKSISYPATNQNDLMPNRGFFPRERGANPAAGAECIFTVGTGRVKIVQCLYLTLTTSAAVANRRVHVIFRSEGDIIFQTFSDIDQTASTTKKYVVSAMHGLPDREDDNVILITIPENIVLTGDETIETLTTNLQAGDNWGVPIMLSEEFANYVN